MLSDNEAVSRYGVLKKRMWFKIRLCNIAVTQSFLMQYRKGNLRSFFQKATFSFLLIIAPPIKACQKDEGREEIYQGRKPQEYSCTPRAFAFLSKLKIWWNAGILSGFLTQRNFLSGKYCWQGLVGEAICQGCMAGYQKNTALMPCLRLLKKVSFEVLMSQLNLEDLCEE